LDCAQADAGLGLRPGEYLEQVVNQVAQVCLLGFGEVGQILAEDLVRKGELDLCTYDIKFSEPDSVPKRALAVHPSVKGCDDPEAAASACELVVSAVTAAEALAATQSIVAGMDEACFYLDLNSISPATTKAAAAVVENAGGRYVEAAVMSSIGPRRIESPILLGGPHAEAFVPVVESLGFTGARFFSAELGRASAAKMCRSVIIKGMEALIIEALLPARRFGVESEVLGTLQDLLPGVDWASQAHYMIARSLQHGTRRAEEMIEVAATVREAGLEPLMSEACARRQTWAPQFTAALKEATLTDMLDTILGTLNAHPD